MSTEVYEAIMNSFGCTPSIHFKHNTEFDITMETIDETDLFSVIKFRCSIARFDIFEKPDSDGHYKMMSELCNVLNEFLGNPMPPEPVKETIQS